jgi:glycosyltransferase involved in cell wall biosynthesis
MRIGVDCHILTGKFQGSRTYLSNLYAAILAEKTNHDYVFFGHWEGQTSFGATANYRNYLSDQRWKRLTFQTAPLIRRDAIEMFHSNYISPLLLPCRSLLTVHDILYETHPQFFDTAQVIRNRMLIRRSVKKSAQIHTVSEFSRQSIADLYRVPLDRIKVVPNGVDTGKFHSFDRIGSADRIAAEYGVRDYILTVGRLEPRKNHVGLLEAYRSLVNEHPTVGPLVIVGQRDFGYRRFFEYLERTGLEKRVHILDSIDDDRLADVYRGARIFVYPSFAEGFGIPPLEALACGIPVVCSNATALPEVVGHAALLVDPYHPQSIAAAMFKLLTDSVLADQLSAAGVAQAQKWSWTRSAQLYLAGISELE